VGQVGRPIDCGIGCAIGQQKDPLTIDMNSNSNTSSGHESLLSVEHNMWVERARRKASLTWKAKDAAKQATIKARKAENKKASEVEKQL
jgi:hypothetical protein